jgi:hypothetical protein
MLLSRVALYCAVSTPLLLLLLALAAAVQIVRALIGRGALY